MVETHKRKRKNTVITKITLTISNAEHIKKTCGTAAVYVTKDMDSIDTPL